MKFSDEHGLAYAMVSVDSSGSYICSGDNFVDSLERRVDLVYVGELIFAVAQQQNTVHESKL